MHPGMVVILLLWLVFVIAYFFVRGLYPDLAKGKRKWKKQKKYDEDGFDKDGFSALGFHRNGTRYDDNGLDRYGNRRPAEPMQENEKDATNS